MPKQSELSELEVATDRALRELSNLQVGSDDYAKTLDQVVKLHKMLGEEKPSTVSKDTMVLVGANLLGILMIIKHEFLNVITSRAINLVIKPRV